MMKTFYVTALRAVKVVAARTGLLRVLDAAAPRWRAAAWVRSLLAIYDAEGLMALDVPWWTFAAADLVSDHLADREARVFEWGSGASTVWLSRRAGSVIAVEHDAAWAATVQQHLPAHAEVRVVGPEPVTGPGATTSSKKGHEGLDFTKYVDAIEQVGGRFDLIVIDGRAREACLGPALRHLAPGGWIVFDNVDRRRYREAIAQHAGLEVRWTRGLTPSLPYPTRTALIRVRGS
jgi:hypothetical protein